MTASILGLDRGIEIVAADPADPQDTVRNQNPLGKVPTLILDDGTALYDSRVIVEYLDYLAGGGRIIPTAAGARFAALRLQALADGIMDACLQLVYEQRWRDPAKHEPKWLDHQTGKIERSLAVLESSPPEPVAQIGQIALACALAYMDLRLDGTWRTNYPRLVRFLGDFAAAVPAFDATRS